MDHPEPLVVSSNFESLSVKILPQWMVTWTSHHSEPKNWGPLAPQRPELLLKDFGATKGWEEDLPCVSHKTQCGVNLGLQLIGWLAAALRPHAISFLWYRAEVLKVFPVGNLAAPDS